MTGSLEWLDDDPGPKPPAAPGRRRSAALIAAAVVLAAVGVGVALGEQLSTSAAHSRPARASISVPPPSDVPPAVVALANPLPGLAADVNVYVRTPDSVLRFQFARGRVTSTAVPPLQSTGPVSFLATPDGVLIRPLDLVPGYEVPDEGPVRELPAPPAGGLVLPGPDVGHYWTADPRRPNAVMDLVSTSGTPAASLALPGGLLGPPVSDGSGYLLVNDSLGVLDVRPGGTRLVIADGVVLAAGADSWLVASGAVGQPWPVTLVTSHPAAQRRLDTELDVLQGEPMGVISPTGRVAAVFDGATAQAGLGLELVDLSAGTARTVGGGVLPGSIVGSAAFSPDGRWLFVADEYGRLVAVDVRTGQTQRIATASPVLQVAVRP